MATKSTALEISRLTRIEQQVKYSVKRAGRSIKTAAYKANVKRKVKSQNKRIDRQRKKIAKATTRRQKGDRKKLSKK